MTYVALLRGINVGGNRKVDMKALKATFERAGMGDVRTYINSGNVIFGSDSRDKVSLARTLEAAIEADFGFPVRVLLRDAEDMRVLVDALPDEWVNGSEAKCDVMFLGDEVDSGVDPGAAHDQAGHRPCDLRARRRPVVGRAIEGHAQRNAEDRRHAVVREHDGAQLQHRPQARGADAVAGSASGKPGWANEPSL